MQTSSLLSFTIFIGRPSTATKIRLHRLCAVPLKPEASACTSNYSVGLSQCSPQSTARSPQTVITVTGYVTGIEVYYTHSSIHPLIRPPIHLLICLSIYFTINSCIHPIVCPFINWYIYPSHSFYCFRFRNQKTEMTMTSLF